MNITYPLIGASVVIGVVGQFLLKFGMDRVGRIESVSQIVSPATLLKMITVWQVPVALGCYALGAILWMGVLSREDVNYAYPFLGFTYVLVLLVGYLMFGEHLTSGRVIGTVLVAVGVFFVAKS